tara:strand:- start:196 stop:393 length:198 start_codon:yes stop_codon:yes gene_type:complete
MHSPNLSQKNENSIRVCLLLRIERASLLPGLFFVRTNLGQSLSIFMAGEAPDFTAEIATDFADTE